MSISGKLLLLPWYPWYPIYRKSILGNYLDTNVYYIIGVNLYNYNCMGSLLSFANAINAHYGVIKLGMTNAFAVIWKEINTHRTA